MSLRAARALEQHGVRARVVDLRWLAPLPVDDILREARATGRVLVVDETRKTGGVSEGIITALVDAGFDGKIARVASRDSFIPLGDAANLVLVSEADVEQAALELAGPDHRKGRELRPDPVGAPRFELGTSSTSGDPFLPPRE
jgi:2-oxoisovalerate dehydrogenase E1 component